jgi:phosphoglycerate dehydrogenase-like enzyme
MNLLILNPFAKDYKKILEPKFPVLTIHPATREEEIGNFIEKAEILLTHRISDAWVKKASRLQWIQATTSGVDYVLNLPSLRKEVLLTSTRGIHGPQMSEMAILFMLALNRNFPQMVRNQDLGIWERWPGRLLFQKKVGVLGVGVVGEEIARKCKTFGMTVFGIGVRKKQVDSVDSFYGTEDLLEVAPEVDYLIIVAPLTPQTRKMVGRNVFSSMKSTAFLINLARGEIVDEEALIEALKTRQISGAALDVFWEEPLPTNHPLWKCKNVIITPHIGGMSDIYVEQVLSIFEENLRRFLRGEKNNLMNLIKR